MGDMREGRKEESRNKEAVDEDRDKEDLGKEKRQRQVKPFQYEILIVNFTALPALVLSRLLSYCMCYLLITSIDVLTLFLRDNPEYS